MKFAIILLFVSTLFGGHEVHHINKDLSHLNLSEKQNAKIKKVLQEFRKDLKKFKDDKENIQERKKELFTKDVLNLEQLSKLNYELYKKTNELENRLLKDIHVILNKTQRFEFVHYFDEWKVK
ncbi:MAG: hypothetical protein OQK48_09490 [Sulfurimonas sp.]|uniref:hypothetical protein n=1 Tax=Sulfurimonas sp. TaxID=2022749 RepID=UPI0026358000|nr:hypothetical protein [Sulfurimonas sp.]MCW8894513.1 hypothetical protein [Sulfurimonas sp.]MCW8955159.1 hypothetical protein [Sulfurimonas sp.]MCW9067774.1 hypothetical protein [Sulfurimonas sp.]